LTSSGVELLQRPGPGMKAKGVGRLVLEAATILPLRTS
jgi:hypothetical protein